MARWTLTGLQEGMTYAIQGITIVLQNPNIRKERFLKIFIYLSMVSFILLGLTNVLIAIPIHVVRFILWFSSSDKASQADDALESANRFVREIVASVPLLALLFMRYVYPKPLDDLFMESLRYLDSTHPDRAPYASILAQQKFKRRYWADMKEYMLRTWKKVRLGLLLLLLSMIPFVGRFVFPAAGAYTTYKALGKTQGIAVGICFFFLPRWATMKLVRALIGMRSLMRELLAPYFVRMRMSHREKRRWFSGRKDVLFGFSGIAYIIIRLPIVGIIGYGIAQAAAAYMLTVVTEPPSKDIFTKKLDEHDNSVDNLKVPDQLTETTPNKKMD
ncbi:hypothetical protein V8B55DRAFT_1462074 [Mucor lusitanicus]|uniref:Transmembrane protein UsgS n=3 Tax=Mucor circinelloides f. lusitanicus TaxID=29924 RepID=A0A168JUH7_MUCCL|nr:hypothetical protein FB192DRAFT_1353689 [Mucor lusitanicus]OAD01633.1 hypothetical protein MUCCIDRAFT_113100 [Mucor lusitanicus CBS 277.49]